MARVVLAMSGGVDSSVAAHLLIEQGHDVIGVFMRHGEKAISACSIDGTREKSTLLPVLNPRADHKQGCCSALDAEDGRRVAERLGIPFYALNLEEEFRQIIDYFVDEYTAGRTPNPCVQCNNWIKFGKLFEYADGVAAEYVATGHYARLQPVGDDQTNSPSIPRLVRGIDLSKDQSYVLFGIRREYLRRMLLPVGHFDKTTIRRIATDLGLNVAEKRDSQEICFVTSGHHGEFVRERNRSRQTSGEIVTTTGHVVGHHAGIEAFTIGQRKGLGVAMGEPYFVTRIDATRNQVVIGKKEDLGKSRLVAKDLNWLVEELPGGQIVADGTDFPCLAQIRYNSRAAPAFATIRNGELHITFETPQFGVAPGQAVVCYLGEQVIGGGWIESSND
ncbi:MAG TPA: tRNA 2-thiouridine(34) synthase MnmA [Pirellulaceae bacterium]|nr:tRNA 2-thiouridine(34) synthase MnmA [Pirellulaceae bacterium]HMO90768.1 tRNA 2-thiouridine(34) synthase MnmA [Pirellulaceae bacterium]HMP68019.1 tRNA 2-thiouridine(34) synthase MnmA [Pirellulaceae bacterium]